MEELKFNVHKNFLTIPNPFRPHIHPAADTVHYLLATFDFDPTWDGFEKRVYFKNASYNIVRGVLLGESNTCYIPWEVLAHTGVIRCNVIGLKYSDETVTQRITTNPVVFEILVDESILEPYDQQPLTPTEYEQFRIIFENVYSSTVQARDDAISAKDIAVDIASTLDAPVEAAEDFSKTSEAYAVGTRGGVPVTDEDDTYQNNSKYYSELAKDYVDNILFALPDIVDDWLETHPEVTTTVQDNAITFPKLNDTVKGTLQNQGLGTRNFKRLFRYISENGTPANGQGGCVIDQYKTMYAICYPDHEDNKVLLIEYDKSIDTIIRAVTVVTGHNDVMTYNPDTNELYICPLIYYTSPTSGNRWRSILVYDYFTLTLKKEITSVEADGVAYDRTTKKTYYYDFSYNLYEIDMETEETTELFTLDSGVSNQNIAADNRYIYFCTSFPNNVAVYDLTGNLISNIPIAHSYSYYTVGELEWFDVLNGVCYFGSKTYAYDNTECILQIFETDMTNRGVQYIDGVRPQYTIYIDANSTSNNPDGTETNPFKSLGEAGLYSGEAVHITDLLINSGNYHGTLRKGVDLKPFDDANVVFDTLTFYSGVYGIENCEVNTIIVSKNATCVLKDCDTSSAVATIHGICLTNSEFSSFSGSGTFINNTKYTYAVVTQVDWTLSAWSFVKTNNVVFVKIEAKSLTTNTSWVTVSNGYPKPSRTYYMQGMSTDGHPFKLRMNTNGELAIANSGGVTNVKIDTTMSYPVV